MSSTPINTFTTVGLQPWIDPRQAHTIDVALAPSSTFAAGQVLGEQLGTNAKHQVSITGVPTGGTFTLTFGGQTTAAIAFGASAQAVQKALEALSSVGNGNVLVTGGWNNVGAVFQVEYVGALGGAAQTTITCSIASLTGGTPAQSTSSVQTGAAATPGQYKAYSETNTDGSQNPTLILKYACATDGSGNITFGTASGGGPFGDTYKAAPAYFCGTFLTADLTGYDANCARQPGWRQVSGTPASGIVRLG